MEENKETERENIPAGQVWFDKIFFLLIASILISALLYNVWGIVELLLIPAGP